MINPRILACTLLLSACAKDTTITHGAEGAHDWQRRLENAIPLGTTVDSARRILAANGFTCRTLDAIDSTMWCDKHSGGRFQIVMRRWQAVLHVRADRIGSLRGTTGLTGP